MKIGDITNDGWEICEIIYKYRKRIITRRDHVSKKFGFGVGVKGWIYLDNEINDPIKYGYVILDNDYSTKINYDPHFFEILDTTKIIRRKKLEKINSQKK